MLVVWDNGGIHRSVEVNTFLWLNAGEFEVRRFPPYAPELNPDEGIWDVLKNDKLANYCPTSLPELQGKVEAEASASCSGVPTASIKRCGSPN